MQSKLRIAIGLGLAATVGLATVVALAVEPIDDLSGDALTPPAASIKIAPPTDFPDIPLASSADISAGPVAANPKNGSRFAAAFATSEGCYVRSTADGGKTWVARTRLPMPANTQNCGNPTLTWAPDGSQLYAAYSYFNTYSNGDPKDSGVIVSVSKNQGTTWSSPVSAMHFTSADRQNLQYASLVRLATPRETDSQWVYLVMEAYIADASEIFFSRSNNRGQTWSGKTLLGFAGHPGGDYSPTIAGGNGGEVLVTTSYWWGPTGETGIGGRRSGNYGASFGQPFAVAQGMYNGDATVAFGVGGVAHVVFANSTGVYYIFSLKTPYTTWSAPVKLNGGNAAQYYANPSLTVSACGSDANVLHVVWAEFPSASDNYNVYYARKLARTGYAWSPGLRVSSAATPTSSSSGLGIAANANSALAVWGTPYDFGPVRASRIAPGVTCP